MMLVGCGGDPFTAGSAAEEIGAPDAMPDSGGAESIGHDAGSEEHDSGSIQDGSMMRDAADVGPDAVDEPGCMLKSTASCGPDIAVPPYGFCQNAAGLNTSNTTPYECRKSCTDYNCTCFMSAFQSGAICIDYLMMQCSDSQGFVQILCSQLKD